MLWKYLAGAAASRAGDEMTGPALAAVIAAGLGARTAVIVAAALVALALPSACWPPGRRSQARWPAVR